MKKELELQLVKEFPSFFREYGGDVKKTCMGRGIECADGWYDLLHRLCIKLQELVNADPTITNFRFAQIKEKFGLLTVYARPTNEQIWRLLDTYCELSSHVCECCGSENNVTTKGRPWWIQTLCNKCAKLNPRI